MKQVLLASFLTLLTFCSYSQITAVGGEWTTNASWDCNCQPGDGDVVIIPAGVTITITNQFIDLVGEDLTITIEDGGELALIDNDGSGFFGQARIRFGSGTTIDIEAGGTVSSSSDNFFLDLNRIEICDGFGCFISAFIPEWNPNVDPSPLTGPSTIGAGGTVPVELLYFEAGINQDIIQINWATSLEENFSHFEIEYSVDQENYTVLGAVDGVGESTGVVEYSFLHSQPMIGTNYYRLNAIDIDGTQEYFGPVEVEYIGEPDLVVYPNPVSDFQLNADLNFQPERPLRITIMDHSGRIIMDIPTDQAKNQIDLPSSTASGLYLLMVSDGARRLTKRFVVD